MDTERDDILRPSPLDPQDRELIDAYINVGVPVDQLPYSTSFEELFAKVVGELGLTDDQHSRKQVFHRLANLRKSGRLPRLERLSSNMVGKSF